MGKRVDLNTALDMIHDGDGVAVSGFMLMTVPREIYRAIGERFQETGHPCGLTLMHGAGNGNNKDQGICEMSYEGLITFRKQHQNGRFSQCRQGSGMELPAGCYFPYVSCGSSRKTR